METCLPKCNVGRAFDRRLYKFAKIKPKCYTLKDGKQIKMATKLKRVPTLLTDEEFDRMERERTVTRETRSNWIRRNKLKSIENRGGKRAGSGRKDKLEDEK